MHSKSTTIMLTFNCPCWHSKCINNVPYHVLLIAEKYLQKIQMSYRHESCTNLCMHYAPYSLVFYKVIEMCIWQQNLMLPSHFTWYGTLSDVFWELGLIGTFGALAYQSYFAFSFRHLYCLLLLFHECGLSHSVSLSLLSLSLNFAREA